MKRVILTLITCACSCILLAGTAWGIEFKMERPFRRYLSFSTKEPGTPPENAFPLVCYIITLPHAVVDDIQEEAKSVEKALSEGKIIHRPLAEKYKKGVPAPAYVGYYIISEDYRIRYVSLKFGERSSPNLKEFNGKRKSFPIKPPRWSWNGALACIQWLSDNDGTDVMAYTMGVPPDPNYVPQIKKPYIIPLSKIFETSIISFWPKEGDFDATIINLKPGMKFKVIDKDFIIP